jgi:serine/threonine-protein kinase
VPSPSSSVSSSPSSFDDARFTAGTVIAERYRIIGRLGKGGMGEVYRADDLTLGQPVALKFLPQELADDRARLDGFLAEVRIARQISHANVCRVYDIQEVDGQRFISMEYVDGEDLASLLRRIGRYSKDKASEIARQICAGLAGAHDRGVLHRDLKPANIMIDGRGKVRITDFGLAALAGEVAGAEIRSGTPAYMAPEQLKGQEVTQRSDIYALGLVLYELFTGRPVHEALSREEPLRSQTSGSVTSPSSHVDDMDPAAERIILKCLEQEPRDRPASALAVAAALPGGDPLAAALAAGETPSPEMVAAAGVEGALKPAIAWGLLAAGVVLTLAASVIGGWWEIIRYVDLPLPPAALEVRARNLIRDLGHDAPVGDTASQFGADFGSVNWISDNDDSPERWDSLRGIRPSPVLFWYRQSPRSLVARPVFTVVGYDNPVQSEQGMARVQLDPEGRLLLFEAIPRHFDDREGPWEAPDWRGPFEEAGLDMASFTQVPPAWAPRMASDVQVAWEGATAERPDLTLRVEAAGYRGKPVSFVVRGHWVEPPEMVAEDESLTDWLSDNLGLAVMTIGSLIIGIVFARRNVRAGRSDTRGAFRLALWFFLIHTGVWALWASHVSDLGIEWSIVQADVGYNLFLAASLWLLYVGLEPYVRRRWPDSIIAWSRLLRGKFRDPLIGRDILIGGVLAGTFGLVIQLDSLVPFVTGQPIASPHGLAFNALGSVRWTIGATVDGAVHALLSVMQGLFILLLLRILLRKIWLAGIVFALLIAFMEGAPGADQAIIAWIQVAAITSVVLFVLVRYGLVATTVGLYLQDSLDNLGLTGDFSVWYAPSFLIPAVVALALLLYGFHTSLAGQPIFGSGKLLEE